MSLNTIPPVTIMDGYHQVSANSDPVHVLFTDNISLQFIYGAGLTGSLAVQVSNNATLNVDGTISGGTWTPFTVSGLPTLSGSAGNGYVQFQLNSAFTRVAFTGSGGGGTLTTILTGKPI